MQDSLDLTTIVFLALAVFVIWRLRSVLGQRTGNERQIDPFRRSEQPKPSPERTDSNVVTLPGASVQMPDAATNPDRWRGLAEPGSASAAGLDQIAAAEPAFDGKAFLGGAKMAYESIVIAFAAGDRRTLKSLLSKDVYEGFERAITDREKRGERAETTFVSIDDASIANVDVKGRNAQVTVRFVSKLITVTRDAKGAAIDGSPDTVVEVTDVWTFARTLGARDPNWQLVATESGQ